MKNWYVLLVYLFLSSFASYGQNVYQHFTELKGMEGYNGNTNLLYRLNSVQKYTNSEFDSNSIFILNPTNKTDSLFQLDYGWTDDILDGYSRSVLGYDFWNKDPGKYIVCGVDGSMEPYPFVDRYDKKNIFQNFMGEVTFIGISRQNDSLVYCTFSDGLYKSTTGGINWGKISDFHPTSISPYNDKVLFTSHFYKSTDGGLTNTVVDSLPPNNGVADLLFYDKDSSYIYCVSRIYQDNPEYRLLVSDKSGNANSWQSKFTSSLPIFLSVDNAIAGSVYLATNKDVYHSTDFGNSFSLFKSFDRRLTGIYKKPGSPFVYAATYYTIYEFQDPLIHPLVDVIKQILIDSEIFKFDPLAVGNKWVYNRKLTVVADESNFVHSVEIIKDTMLISAQIFKQIKNVDADSVSKNISCSYERIDSSTGKVYLWNIAEGHEYQIDDLTMTLGDSINASRFDLLNGPTSFDSLYNKNIFGLAKENHVFRSLTNPLGYGDRYSLTKDLGLTYRLESWEQVFNEYVLKGAII